MNTNTVKTLFIFELFLLFITEIILKNKSLKSLLTLPQNKSLSLEFLGPCFPFPTHHSQFKLD